MYLNMPVAKKRFYFIGLVFILIFPSLLCPSQNINYLFEKYINETNELTIQTILRDENDFLWLGTTDGLFRSDGSNLTIFTSDDKTNSFASENIFSLFKYSKEELWVGSTKGLDIFNYRTENFTHLDSLNNFLKSENVEIRDMVTDKNGDVWFATYNNLGLIKYSPATQKFVQFPPALFTQSGKDFKINTIEYNNSDILWIGTEIFGLFKIEISTTKIEKVNLDDQNIDLIINDLKLIGNQLWIGTWNNGLISYFPQEKKIVKHISGQAYSKKFSSNNVRQISVGSDGLLYLASFGGGIQIFDPNLKTVSVLLNDPKTPNSLPSNIIWTTLIDKDNILWASSVNQGLSRTFINRKNFRLLTFAENGIDKPILDVAHAIKDNNGNIYILTYQEGLFKYNILTQTTKHIEINKNNPPSVYRSLTIDIQNRIWMGCDQGLFILDNNSDKIIYNVPSYTSFLKEIGHTPQLLYADTEGNVWISGWQTGIFKIPAEQIKSLKPTNFKPQQIVINKNDSLSLQSNNIIFIYEDSNKNIWFSADNVTLKLDKNQMAANIVSDFDMRELAEDRLGNFWISGQKYGLIKYNPKTNTYQNLSHLFVDLTSIPSLISDTENNIWISANDYIIRYNYQNNTTKYYKAQTGIFNINFNGSTFQINESQFFMGGQFGCFILTPSKLTGTLLPKPVLSNLYIYNKPVQVNEKIENQIILDKILNDKAKITIPPYTKSFAIEFSSHNFIDPDNTKYAYKLEGIDNDWVYPENNINKITYTYLPAGDYTFKAAIVSPFEDWENNNKSVLIEITEPFYKTKWFIATMVLAISLLVAIIIFYRIRQIKQKNIELEELVEKRTYELTKSNHELEERQAIIEDQKEELYSQKDLLEENNTALSELNATKDKFFSIIGHDLKNPFNAILGYSQILADDYDTFDDDDRKSMIKYIQQSAENTYTLLENLLFWSQSQKGTIDFEPELINLHGLFQTNLSVVSSNAASKKITITIKSKDKNLELKADKNMLNTVIRNLLTNSIKFTPEGGTINIKAEKEANTTLITITDSGVGMDEKTLKKLFRIDQKINSKGTNDEPGTGLGLILCHEFIKKHKGHIRAESKVGEGTTFFIKFPDEKIGD